MKLRLLCLWLVLACSAREVPHGRDGTFVVEADSPATRGGVLAEAIGIETGGGEVSFILEPGCPLPCEERVSFGTFEDDQNEIVIYLYRGNSGRTADSFALGVVEIAGVPDAPAGELDVHVTFRASKEGVSLVADDVSGAPIELRWADPLAF